MGCVDSGEVLGKATAAASRLEPCSPGWVQETSHRHAIAPRIATTHKTRQTFAACFIAVFMIDFDSKSISDEVLLRS